MNSDEQQNNQEHTFLPYNATISKVKMIDETYSEETKEMCEVALYGILMEIYNNTEVYHRVLGKMRELDLYERYIRVIFELQFNPPQEQQIATGDNNTSPSKPEQNNNQSSNSNVATKQDDTKEISKKFIRDIFNDDNNFNL